MGCLLAGWSFSPAFLARFFIPLTEDERLIMLHEFVFPRVVQGFLADVAWVFRVLAKVIAELAHDLGGAAHFNTAAFATDCTKEIETHC